MCINIAGKEFVKGKEKQLRKEQRKHSRKYENLERGETIQKNLQKQKLKVQKTYKVA